ncbi:GumN protein [Devosia nitrariae]|uniref:GumN protein n=2 Tax=Devosia nitrariae TaxID=2071872 RepID=A0ABQ5WDG8_9HYPH|nr:GumN protein [Devosia nitrariae]
MWRLSDSDSTLYLFGTVHLMSADVEWRTPEFETALKDVDTIVLEADVTSPEALKRMGEVVGELAINPPGVTLSSLLGPERAARVVELAESLGLPSAGLEGFRPWFALTLVSIAAMQKEGHHATLGADQQVLDQALGQGHAVDYFETAEEQLLILAGLDDEVISRVFEASLAEYEDFGEHMTHMLDVWRMGDLAGLEAMANKSVQKVAPAMYEAMFVARNRAWIERIEEMMAGEGDYFIAVGAGHFVGEDGLVDLLEERGHTLERIQ